LPVAKIPQETIKEHGWLNIALLKNGFKVQDCLRCLRYKRLLQPKQAVVQGYGVQECDPESFLSG